MAEKSKINLNLALKKIVEDGKTVKSGSFVTSDVVTSQLRHHFIKHNVMTLVPTYLARNSNFQTFKQLHSNQQQVFLLIISTIQTVKMSDGTFLVSITGQIETIDILAPSGTSWHCKYEFVTGPDWKIIGGLESGLSQTSNVVVNGDRVVLNLPIEVNFKSTNIYGCKNLNHA